MFPYSDILGAIIYGQEGSAQHILIIIILSGHTHSFAQCIRQLFKGGMGFY